MQKKHPPAESYPMSSPTLPNFQTSLFAVMLLAFALPQSLIADNDWKQFRGPGGCSAAEGLLPTEFDETKNIAWKTDLPAKGASSPIVVGDKVFVTCSGGIGQSTLYTVCVDARTGEKLWTQKFLATGRCFVHKLSANAAPTPASDGQRVYAFYSSNDLACMDFDGNLLWYRGLAYDRPKAGNDVGMSSSPVVADGVVVAQVENEADSFCIGLDAKTGETRWSLERPQDAMWSSPLIVKSGERSFVLLQSKSGIDLVDVKTGKVLGHAGGDTSSISSAAVVGDTIYAPVNGTSAYKFSPDGKLELQWNTPRMRPASMSTIVTGGKLYTLNKTGVLTTYNAADGKEISSARAIKGSNWATPVLVNGYLYSFTQNGKSFVIKLPVDESDDAKVVKQTEFTDQVFLGSPAVSNNAMYFRSDKALWKMAAE